jgi:hypothetical protein
MPDTDQEIARRVLESVLRRLDERAPVAPAPSVLNTTAGGQDSPMIFIVLGNLELSQNGERNGTPLRTATEAATIINKEMPPASAATLAENTQAMHPGLEKFPLTDAQANTAVPKTCFMEPDRICVHSGACQMRGV